MAGRNRSGPLIGSGVILVCSCGTSEGACRRRMGRLGSSMGVTEGAALVEESALDGGAVGLDSWGGDLGLEVGAEVEGVELPGARFSLGGASTCSSGRVTFSARLAASSLSLAALISSSVFHFPSANQPVFRCAAPATVNRP